MAEGKRGRGRNRGRMLQQPEQRSTDLAVLRSELRQEAPTLRVEILVEFARALIREHPSTDVLVLALMQAKHQTGASDEEMDLLKIAVLSEASATHWPEGFFG